MSNLEWTTVIVAYAIMAGTLGGVIRLSDFPRVKLSFANAGEIVYAIVSSIILALLVTWYFTEQLGIDITAFAGFIAVAFASMAGMAGIRALAELPVIKAILKTSIQESDEEEAEKGGVVEQSEELTIEPK